MTERFMGTTRVSVTRTVAQIQGVLARCGATAVLIDYVGGEPKGISFKVTVGKVELPFILPCQWENMFQQMKDERSRILDEEALKIKAKAIAWRQTLRWVEAQMAFIEARRVKAEEVFLPYLQVSPTQTLFQKMAGVGWNVKRLTEGDKKDA